MNQDALNSKLFDACHVGDFEAVNRLMDAGAQIDAKQGDQQMSPIHLAAQNGHSEVVLFLSTNGADIDALNAKGETPLHLAAYEGHDEVCETLIEYGADVNANEHHDKWTPLHEAAVMGHHEVVSLLLENDANPAARSKSRETPAHLAAGRGHVDTLMTLADYDDGVLALKDGQDATCAHLAAHYDHEDVLTYLQEMGESLRGQDKYGATPMHYAAMSGREKAVEFLIDHGAKDDLNAQDRYGETPLIMAAKGDNDSGDVCSAMLKAGADPEIRGFNGKIALDVAQHPRTIGVIECEMASREIAKNTDKISAWSPSPQEGADLHARLNTGQSMQHGERQEQRARMRL